MKNKLTNIIIFIFCIIFVCSQLLKKPEPKVLKVITPSIIEIDLNNNNIADNNEIFCMPEDKFFTANLKYDNTRMINNREMKYEEALAIGYMTDQFAKNLLEGNNVKITDTSEIKPNCKHADIYINNIKYTDILKQNGYYAYENNYKDILDKAKKLNLVILNHKSSKYHTLDCKYAKAAEDAVVLPLKEIPKESLPCKFCHISRKNSFHSNLHKYDKKGIISVASPPNIISDGSIKLILTDYTKITSPDRKCLHQVCKEFVNAINSAVNTIDIAAYGIVNIPDIYASLENAIIRGVKVRLIYDINSNGENYYPETLDIVKNFSETSSDNIIGKPSLTNMLMHNKFAVFDRHIVYTGSMNFSATGFSGFNHNNILIIDSEQLANLYTKEFDQMFSGKFHTLKKKLGNNPAVIVGNSIINVYFSPQDKPITNALIPLIRNSKQYIYIPTFIITHKALKGELIRAKQRGIDVKIIIDATSLTKPNSLLTDIKKSGIPVKVENFAGKVHSKTMIIDDEYIIAGSTNFSNSGDDKNDENMLIISSPKLAVMYKDFFNYLWQKIPEKYLKYNISAESKDSIGSCQDGVDNDYDGKIDNDDDGCK